MIVGEFDQKNGEPFVHALVFFPRLRIADKVPLLLDTGASRTLLHPKDARILRVPFSQLGNAMNSVGIGGEAPVFIEPAVIFFFDMLAEKMWARAYEVELNIAKPNRTNETLPSLLGRDITNHWNIHYDPTASMLECTVRYADYTLEGLPFR